MTRLPAFVGFALLVPVAVAAQPAPRPAPPAPRPTQTPMVVPAPAPRVLAPELPPLPEVALAPRPDLDLMPLAPLPMLAPVPPQRVVIDPDAVDAIRQAAEAARDAARDARRVDLDAMRQAMDEARVQLHDFRFDMPDIHVPLPDAHVWSDFDLQASPWVTADQGASSDASLYSNGLGYIQRHNYDQAIVYFDRALARKGTHGEGALYWKAFAQYKLGKTTEALAAIADLRKSYPQSSYLNDAKVLEADVRKLDGQPVNVAGMDDEELKILAIHGILNADPDRALPLIEGVLNATNSLSVKKEALYVLAGSDDARAHQILLKYAKGAGNPDLQSLAIRYLASTGKQQTTAAELREIYESTQDPAIRSAIIDAYARSGNKNALFTIISSSGSTPVALRQRAVNGVGDLATPQEIWTLYQKEENRDLRMQMVSAFSSMGAIDQLTEVAKTEKDPAVKQRAIRSLGNAKADKTGSVLTTIYAADSDKDTRKTIISALANQGNAEALVALARKETSLDLKTEIVRRLSDMAPKSKVAADYLMEVIK